MSTEQLRSAFRAVLDQLDTQLFDQSDSVRDGRLQLLAIARRISDRGLSNLPAGNYAGETAALNAAAGALRDARRGTAAAVLQAMATARNALNSLAARLGV
jgi:hypothetical protein